MKQPMNTNGTLAYVANSTNLVYFLLCPYRFGMLGSIDSNTGSPDLGWDTDQFPMDVKNAAFVMKVNRNFLDGPKRLKNKSRLCHVSCH